MTMPVRAQFQTSWATFVAIKDAFDQCLYRPQVEVAREVLRARDLLIDLEKVALHPALNEEWNAVSDLNVGIVEALKLKQPVLVALFIARRLGEATASEKTGVIRTAHAQLKEMKAMGGKGGFAELANWVIPPHAMARSGENHQGQPTPPTAPAAVLEGGGGVQVAPVTLAAHTWEGLTVAGEGTPAAACGTTAPRTGGSTGDAGGKGGRGARRGGSGRGPAVCRKCTLAGSTSTNHPHTMCPLNECFNCVKSGHIRHFYPN